MKLSQERLENGVCRMAMEGSLDIVGSAQVDQPFTAAAEKENHLVVDISGVDFLASIGIRVLVKTAKVVAERGGRMAVYGAQEAPKKVLQATGVDGLINLVADESSALDAVSG